MGPKKGPTAKISSTEQIQMPWSKQTGKQETGIECCKIPQNYQTISYRIAIIY